MAFESRPAERVRRAVSDVDCAVSALAGAATWLDRDVADSPETHSEELAAFAAQLWSMSASARLVASALADVHTTIRTS